MKAEVDECFQEEVETEEHITQVAKRGGVHEIVTFSKIFFPKDRFLSDYVVRGCPKYFFGKLRSFLKISEKKSKFFFWATLSGID